MLTWVYFVLFLAFFGAIVWLDVKFILHEVKEHKKEKDYKLLYKDCGEWIEVKVSYRGEFDKEIWDRVIRDFYEFKRKKRLGKIDQAKKFFVFVTVYNDVAGTKYKYLYDLEKIFYLA